MIRTPMSRLYRELPASLLVSDQDNDVLRNLVSTLVSHNVQQYGTLVVTREGYPDLSSTSSRWKEMRRKNKLRIYRERPPAPPSKGQAPPFTPSLLLMGTVEGKVDDVMYGVIAATDADMKIKSTIVQDGLVDCKVLHDLVGPSFDDPFHHAAVKWRLYNNRDYVSLDATGSILSDVTREKIGYNLIHSVAFPQLPSFEDVHGVARGNMSMCALYRQKTPTIVEVYVRGFFDFGGKNEVANNIALQAIATQWLAFSRKAKCAQMKKLVWRLRKNSVDSTSSTGSSSCGSYGSSSSSGSSPSLTPGLCALCRHSFGFLGTSRETCTSCLQSVCTRCCVKKRVCVMAPDGRTVLEKRRAFCSECVSDVDGRDAVSIAREQLLDSSSLRPDDADVVYGYRQGRSLSGDDYEVETSTKEVAPKTRAQPIPRRHALAETRDWWTHSA